MLKSIKKIMLTLCCLLMLMCLCACSGKDNDEVNNNDVNLNQYSLVQNVYSWGSGYSKIILSVDFKKDVDYLDTSAYTVLVKRFDKNGKELNSGERVVTAAYQSDEKGKSSSKGDYVTLDLATTATTALSSPYYTDPDSFGKTLKAWAKCEYMVTIKNSDDAWNEENTVYHPDEEKFLTSIYDGEKKIPYAYYEASTNDKHPLIVWLHGAGSGGTDIGFVTGGMLVNNFVSDDVQSIFDGADILLPQCETVWMDDGSGNYTSDGSSVYESSLKSLIDEYLRTHENVDANRVYIGGCSNGGYMTVKLVMDYPEMFAASFPICEAYKTNLISDEEVVKLASVPTWFVHCANDPVVDINTTAIDLYERMKEIGADNLHFSVYDSIIDPDYGNAYNGHFAWVYSLKNLCTTDYDGSNVTVEGNPVNLYQWLATNSK